MLFTVGVAIQLTPQLVSPALLRHILWPPRARKGVQKWLPLHADRAEADRRLTTHKLRSKAQPYIILTTIQKACDLGPVLWVAE